MNLEFFKKFKTEKLFNSRTDRNPDGFSDNLSVHADFDKLEKMTDKVKVVHVLSDEEKPGYEHGFVPADSDTSAGTKMDPS